MPTVNDVTQVAAVEQPFDVPRIYQETGEVLDRAFGGTLELLERDADGRPRGRRPQDLGAEVLRPLGGGLAAALDLRMRHGREQSEEDLRLRFDVLTKTKHPELYRTGLNLIGPRTRGSFRLVVEVLHAIDAGGFQPNPSWRCRACQF